jgi:hypothetical protein
MRIDSLLSSKDALQCDQASPAPRDILDALTVIEVAHWAFDGREHVGQLVLHKDIAEEIKIIFEVLRCLYFPIAQIIPISHPSFRWNDESSMTANNTSAWNYRTIAGTDNLSWHAYGRAIDINPLLNLFIQGNHTTPQGASYNPSVPGTITADSPVVALFKEHGFTWGGDWSDRKDYQHFEKPT